jgi:hypothetical protein
MRYINYGFGSILGSDTENLHFITVFGTALFYILYLVLRPRIRVLPLYLLYDFMEYLY